MTIRTLTEYQIAELTKLNLYTKFHRVCIIDETGELTIEYTKIFGFGEGPQTISIPRIKPDPRDKVKELQELNQ